MRGRAAALVPGLRRGRFARVGLVAKGLVATTTEGDAPKGFAKLSRTKVPRNALLFSCMFLLAGVAAALTWVTTISAPCFIFVWSIVLVSYLVYRERRPQLHAGSKFKIPGGTFMPYVVLAFSASSSGR